MKIISKHQDYYDSALAYGSDDSIIYVRKEEHIYAPLEKEYSHGTKKTTKYPKEFNKILNLYSRLPSNSFQIKNNSQFKVITLKTKIVGFCGIIYPLFLLEMWTVDNNLRLPGEERYFYDIDTMEKELESYIKKDSFYKPESKWYDFFSTVKKYQFTEKDILRMFDEIDKINKSNNRFDTFFSIDSPVFVIGYSNELKDNALIKDPVLKDYDFYRLKDPYTTFGEISQFISGVLSSNKKLPIEFTDKEKLRSHGFDDRSFRKDPGSKKRRKSK